ncbi:MAG TPA: hypothetical protein VEQ37_19200 [Actinomycetota bacterium]|nr:hypothetical protein [Actinomycetota bacterium]
MPHQVALTIAAQVVQGHTEKLQQLLEDLGPRPESLPFGRIANLHFARLFVLPETQDLSGAPIPATLIFLSDVDSPVAAFLDALVDNVATTLDQILGHCDGYPTAEGLTRQARLAFLRNRIIPVATAYMNRVGRSAKQIRQEAGLRRAIEGYLDRPGHDWSGRSPIEIRSAVREFVFNEESLGWAHKPASRPELWWRLKEGGHAILLPLVLILLLPLVLIGLAVWVVLLRIHERTEDPTRDVADPADLGALAAMEDHAAMNPFTLVGFVKPTRFRRLTLQAVLGLVSYGVRHVYSHGRLTGIGTIHFARWVFIDGKRRMFFASNYDGSRESYMDDFIDKLARGLNAVGSNGLGYPKTKWLILEGARDAEAFKDFLRTHQLPTPIWYSAYPGLSAANIQNNTRIRAGLYGHMTSKQAQEWLRRL